MILTAIHRYSVKGLSGEAISEAMLTSGQGIPHDRRFALAHASSQFDRGNPDWLPKQHFLTLMRDERLAMLRTRFDPETGYLTVLRDGRQVARGNIETPLGCMLIEQFLDAFLPRGPRGNPHIVEVPGAMLSDRQDKLISIVNLASVTDIERVARVPVDPHRFRANLHVDGVPAWTEMGWPGRTLAIGEARLRVVEPIERCAATEVNPDTGERDLHMLNILRQGFDHLCCGIYARVTRAGAIRRGDSISVNDD